MQDVHRDPRDTVILKIFFNRGKGWVDVERLVACQGRKLDRAEIRRWLVDGVGEEDERGATLGRALS
jgi:hypothetical protein